MERSERKDGSATAGPARTLEELGVPPALARELEGALRAQGEAAGGRAPWQAFVTPDGRRHALRLDDEPGR
jgi:hypothetical protein